MKTIQGLLCFVSIALLLLGGVLSPRSTAHGVVLSTCNGTIAECQAEEELLMDSETHRRFLQQGKTIGYGALNPDRPACNSGAGRPYANCLPARSGNRPSRGCNPYDHCRIG